MTGSSPANAPRAVVDTNVIVSGFITPDGPAAAVLNALSNRRFTLVLSEPLLTELIDVVNRPKLRRYFRVTDAEVRDFLLFSHRYAIFVLPAQDISISSRDPDDNKFLEAAVGGSVDYLVTGDDDLLALRNHPNPGRLHILTLTEFLSVLT